MGRHLGRRAMVLLALALAAFSAGIVVGAGHGSTGARDLAVRFARAWARGDYAAMYSETDARTQQRIPVSAFADAYQGADATATVENLATAGRAHLASKGVVMVPVVVRTRVFGTLHSSFRVPTVVESDGRRVRWSHRLLFPGLAAGERLTRHTTLPARAALLARDGSVLASGPAPAGGGERNSPLGAAAVAAVGETGPIPAPLRDQLIAQGVPQDAQVGVSGLELALDARLRGEVGGELLAGRRVLAAAAGRPAAAVRTSISPSLQRAAVAALGNQLGGVVALRPATGELLAVAGLGINDVQPPGSTFKMITLTAVLEAGLARPSTTFPFATYSTLDGVQLQNANGEDCGGTLAEAFAVSCNSVFAPLGARLGAARLVATAERFGFNQPVGIPGAVQSTIPPASEIQGDLAVGSSAIGQDQVLASPLEMALVAATIGEGGRRPTPSFLPGRHRSKVRVTSGSVARTVRRLMVGVVSGGTGTAAAIPGITVAGKTGTAELVTTACPPTATACKAAANDPKNTDAWFAAFAPARHPRLAVGVLLVKDGAGGDTAAPVARQVFEAGLSSQG